MNDNQGWRSWIFDVKGNHRFKKIVFIVMSSGANSFDQMSDMMKKNADFKVIGGHIAVILIFKCFVHVQAIW